MESKRLLAVASYIDVNDKVIDIGCDHGYLGIYLKENNLVSDLLLTDVNYNALSNAIKNISSRNLDIDTKLTDGLNGIDLSKYNTITISGMGTYTILNILKNNNLIDKLIIQSNNNLDELRYGLNNMGYYLEDEKTIYENGIWYVIGLYKKTNTKNSDIEIKYGILKDDKIDYYKYLIDMYTNISNNIDNSNSKKEEFNSIINELNELLKECR